MSGAASEPGLSVSNNQCLKYVCRQRVSSEDIIFTVHIGYDCLRGFHEARQERMVKQQCCTYIQLLNMLFVIKYCIKVKDKLKDRGFTTRLRSIKKLQQLFLNTLREEKSINSMSLQYTYLEPYKIIVITNY